MKKPVIGPTLASSARLTVTAASGSRRRLTACAERNGITKAEIVRRAIAIYTDLDATLETHGYSVLVARNGAEALRIAKEHAGPIPIMVTDVIMPGIAGPKLAELIAPTRPQMRVLFISGYSEEAVVQHGLAGPGKTFLSKPFGPEVLLRKVRESLDASR